jgi:hypothetical protein
MPHAAVNGATQVMVKSTEYISFKLLGMTAYCAFIESIIAAAIKY